MNSDEDILISQRNDRAWIVSLPFMQRPWAVERTQDEAIAKARQYAQHGVIHIRQPDGREERLPLGPDAGRLLDA